MIGPHPSHFIRSSDASTFDFVCTRCGARDQVPGGWGDLAKPCEPTPDRASLDDSARVFVKNAMESFGQVLSDEEFERVVAKVKNAVKING